MYKINKNETGEYITGVASNVSSGNITRAEYETLLKNIKNKPQNAKRLRSDSQTWEIEIPYESPDDIMPASTIIQNIFGSPEITRAMAEKFYANIEKFNQISELINNFDDNMTLSKLKKLITSIRGILNNGN